MMWILILLICSLPVSGALLAKNKVRGVVGRAITIECHYDKSKYQSHVKYWCHGWTRQCSVVVKTNEQPGWNGRVSITDKKTAGIFVVTMKDLRPDDTGWYSCGIEQSGYDSLFNVKLQISYESVSVPVLRYLSPPNVSCFGGSVLVSCESVQGSLPIQYTWYEKTLSEDSKISDTNKLDLHCQSLKQQHHQYYCTASNNQGKKSSEMVNVTVFNGAGKNCSYVTQISGIGPEYSCEGFSTVSPTTTHSTSTKSTDNRNQTSGSKSPSSLIYIVFGVLGALIVVLAVSLLFYRMQNNKDSNCIICRGGDDTLNDNQQLTAAAGSTLYASVKHVQRSSVETPSEETAQLSNDENEITYATVQFQKRSTARNGEVARHSVNNEDSVIYSGIKIQSQPPKNNREPPSLDTPQDSEMAIYANARS